VASIRAKPATHRKFASQEETCVQALMVLIGQAFDDRRFERGDARL
jgi:hypothetical protein